MSKRFAATEKWDDPWFRKLPNKYKCFWDYVCMKCDLIGIWKKDFEMVNFCLSPDVITEEEALGLFNNGKERIRVLAGGESWFIVDFVSFQYGEINPNNNLHRSVMSRLESLGANEGQNRGSAAPLVKVKEKVRVEVKESLKEDTIKPSFDFEAIWKKYPSNGRVGKKKALTHFVASVLNEQDYADIQKALDNYVVCKRVKEGFIQNATTWFNNWRDWIEYRERKPIDDIPESIRKYFNEDGSPIK